MVLLEHFSEDFRERKVKNIIMRTREHDRVPIFVGNSKHVFKNSLIVKLNKLSTHLRANTEKFLKVFGRLVHFFLFSYFKVFRATSYEK